MAKKQLGAAASTSTDAATKANVDAVVTNNAGTTLTVKVLTEAEYEAIGSPSATILYFTTAT